jgi:hypothetical protein
VDGPDPIQGGSRSHPRGPVCTRGGPGPTAEVWIAYVWGSGTHRKGYGPIGEVLECVTFSGYVAALDLLLRQGQVLSPNRSDCPRLSLGESVMCFPPEADLGRVVTWVYRPRETSGEP